MRIVVTGGAGFIGSAVCRMMVAERGATVLNIDKLTATSSLASLAAISGSPRYTFRKADVCDPERIAALLHAFAPDAIVHAAAEQLPGEAAPAVETNVLGTWRLLQATREYWSGLAPERQARFRFLSASALPAPPSPAAASRRAADELVGAWHHTYGLPTIVSRAADTFGPCQFPHQPVPAAVIAAIDGAPVEFEAAPAHGWLHVEDHARALAAMLVKGTPGTTYAIAGNRGPGPAAMAERIRRLVERLGPKRGTGLRLAALRQAPGPDSGAGEIVTPLPDAVRLEQDTGWSAEETLDSALSLTVRWYLAHEAWWRPLQAAQAVGHGFGGLLRIA